MSTPHAPHTANGPQDRTGGIADNSAFGGEHAQAGDGMSSAEAQRLLDRAGQIDRRATDAMPPVLVILSILCVVGTMTTLDLRVVDQLGPVPDFDARLATLIFSFAWNAVAIIVPFLFRRLFRRGLATRWYAYMGAWGLLWAAGMIFAGPPAALILAPLFLVLVMIAATTEAQAFRAAGGASR